MNNSYFPLLVEWLLVTGVALGGAAIVVAVYGVLRYWTILDTKKNSILAVLFGPISLPWLNVDRGNKKILVYLLRIAAGLFLGAALLFVLGLSLAYAQTGR